MSSSLPLVKSFDYPALLDFWRTEMAPAEAQERLDWAARGHRHSTGDAYAESLSKRTRRIYLAAKAARSARGADGAKQLAVLYKAIRLDDSYSHHLVKTLMVSAEKDLRELGIYLAGEHRKALRKKNGRWV